MSSILYYSNNCGNCGRLLQFISTSTAKSDIHFICIDNRIVKNNVTYIVLENKQELLLPISITKVPSLLLLNRGHQVLFGNDIMNHLNSNNVSQQSQQPQKQNTVQTQQSHQQQNTPQFNEPMAFAMSNNYGYGVASDSFSYLDQDISSLSATGDGGMRQQHHYAHVDNNHAISTPPDTYKSDTIGSITPEQIQSNRDKNIKIISQKN